jgi:hypothetical protein
MGKSYYMFTDYTLSYLSHIYFDFIAPISIAFIYRAGYDAVNIWVENFVFHELPILIMNYLFFLTITREFKY